MHINCYIKQSCIIVGLSLRKTEPDEWGNDLLLYTPDDKIIGCGKIDPLFVAWDYSTPPKGRSIHLNKVDSNGFYFFVTARSVWKLELKEMLGWGEEYTDMTLFIKSIQHDFPEVKRCV